MDKAWNDEIQLWGKQVRDGVANLLTVISMLDSDIGQLASAQPAEWKEGDRAIFKGHEVTIKHLRADGALVEWVNDWGATCLEFARFPTTGDLTPCEDATNPEDLRQTAESDVSDPKSIYGRVKALEALLLDAAVIAKGHGDRLICLERRLETLEKREQLSRHYAGGVSPVMGPVTAARPHPPTGHDPVYNDALPKERRNPGRVAGE